MERVMEIILAISFILFPLLDIVIFGILNHALPFSISRTYYSNIGFMFIIWMVVMIVFNLAYVVAHSLRKKREISFYIFNVGEILLHLLILVFPGNNPNGIGNTGLFQLPMEASAIVHESSAIALFALYLAEMLYLAIEKRKDLWQWLLFALMAITLLLFLFFFIFNLGNVLWGSLTILEFIALSLIAVLHIKHALNTH